MSVCSVFCLFGWFGTCLNIVGKLYNNDNIFPTTLVDGFSKLWLRGKGILRVGNLIPAENQSWRAQARAWPPKMAIFTRFSETAVQK